jgi:hypothetical protein
LLPVVCCAFCFALPIKGSDGTQCHDGCRSNLTLCESTTNGTINGSTNGNSGSEANFTRRYQDG